MKKTAKRAVKKTVAARGVAKKRTVQSRRQRDLALDHPDLPAGFSGDGRRMVPIHHVVDPAIATKSSTELSAAQAAALVSRRLQLTGSSRVAIRMLGVPGVIDNARAIEEVRTMTAVGRAIVDIEMRFIRMLAEQHAGGRP